jgi:Family of unknown function (DUF6526)
MMPEQNFKNHSRMVPLFHFVTIPLLLFALVIASIQFFKTINAGSGRLQAAAMVLLSLGALLGAFFGRYFALRAQDRAIRAEEHLRHYVLTGKPLDKNLRLSQIIALRFAGDEEFAALAKKAVDEKLSNKQIKEAVQHWRADYNRV